MDQTDSARGWLVVAAAFVGLFLNVGVVIVYSFGVLAGAMSEEFGWNAIERGAIFLLFSLVTVIAGPLWGAMVDRHGGRRIVLISSTLLGLGLCAVAIVPGDLRAVIALFALIGLIGSGTLPPAYASIVVGWFDRRRGLALGVTMMGIGAGAAVVPPLSAALVEAFGWRSTFLIFGVTEFAICVPLMAWLLRPSPAASARSKANPVKSLDVVMSAARQRTLWTLTIFALLTGGILVAAVTSFVPMLEAKGMPRGQAAGFQSILGISLIAGRVLVGGLLDRVFAPRVMMGVLLVTALGFLLIHQGDGPFAYALGAVGVGLAIGAEVDFLGYLVSRYYPKEAFATLFAFFFAMYSLGASFGPLLVGWMVSLTGSYQPGLLILSGLTVILAAVTLTLPRYARLQTGE